MKRKKVTFVWPQEPWKPTSLFKHIVYLGETAGYVSEFADVDIYDLSVTKMLKREMVEILRNSDYLMIPIEAYTVTASIRLAKLAKQSGNAKVVVYGTVAAMNPKLLSKHFDLVISTGHWYRAIEKLITNEEEFMSEVVDGIYSKGVHITKEWSYPLFNKMPMDEYHKIMNGQLDIGIQIGCAFNCSFCAEKRLIPEHHIYHRTPKNIYEFVKKYPSEIYYLDATTFTYDREWALEVCDLLSKMDNVPKWRTVTRIDRIDEEIISAMKKAGCFKIGFGIETMSPKLQKSVNKQYDKEKLIKNINIVKKYGIIPRCFLILGIPGQTAEEVRYTDKFVKDMGVEYRWKEYVPFEKIPEFTDVDQFRMFERNSYFMHDIPGIEKEEYVELLSVSR